MHNIPPALIHLARAFAARGRPLYGVGGMVRNPLLGLPVSDLDICSALPAPDAAALCISLGGRARLRSKKLGSAALTFEGVTAEYTCFRTEGYSHNGSHEPEWVRFTSDIAEDAARRDFTANAVYRDLASGRLCDPLGGINDIRRRILRAASPEPSLTMGVDGERILRMCRFAAELGFEVHSGTQRAAAEASRNLNALPAPRVKKELTAILLADARYGCEGGVLRGLLLLERCGALDALLPEVAAGRGMAQNPAYHRHDVMLHLLHTAASAPPVLELRLAGLLHDIGKPPAFRSSGRMYTHDLCGSTMAESLLARMGFSQHIRQYVAQLVRHHMYDLTGEAKESTLRAWFAERGLRLSRDLVLLRRADVHGSGVITGSVATADRWESILLAMQAEGAPFSESELAITGRDIVVALGIPPSPRVGEIKRKLLLHCARRPRDNTRERLLSLMRDM